MNYSQPVNELIYQRYSCRTYQNNPIPAPVREKLAQAIHAVQSGPLGTSLRLELLAANEQDQQELRGLGTYGFIKNPAGYILGAVQPGPKNFEDFGYVIEELVLFASDLNLGTCWLAGSLTRSSFARKIGLQKSESLPAVVSIGQPADPLVGGHFATQRKNGSAGRLPWQTLFFDEDFTNPFNPARAGNFAAALEMVHLAPSASNKQPWRILRQGERWHFYLEHTPGYRKNILTVLVGAQDAQRIDLGIAMCHFDLSAASAGLAGRWLVSEPDLKKPGPNTEYTATWAPV